MERKRTIKISQQELREHLQAHPEDFQAVVAIWTRPEVIEAIRDLGLIVATIHREIAEADHAEEIAAGQTIPFQDLSAFTIAPIKLDTGRGESLPPCAAAFDASPRLTWTVPQGG